MGSSNTTSSTNTTTFTYLGNARLSSITITGDNARTVTFFTDWQGNVIERYETASGTMPREQDSFFDGQRLLRVSNNGDPDPDTSVEIGFHRTPSTGYLQYGTAQSFVDADSNYDALNGAEAGAASRYTVKEGDTLASIARDLWGDESLWYVLADANGIDACAIPPTVTGLSPALRSPPQLATVKAGGARGASTRPSKRCVPTRDVARG